MDTLGPVSVLDSGQRKRDAVVADRITRRRSPDRPKLKQALSELDVVYRIPQPYRTSFSAKHSVERLPGIDRSRSLSPTCSLRSLQSSRSERGVVRRHGRAKSPKRVTYDTRVTVRHSDADDSMFTELSSHECDTSPVCSKSPESLHTFSHMSKDSGLDYSSQLRDLSDRIIKMDWSNTDELETSAHSRHGILKESQNSHKQPAQSCLRSPTVSQPVNSRALSTGQGDKENTPNGSPSPPPAGGDFYNTPKLSATISRDYQHDRTFSYRQAITDHYSSEVRALVDAGVEEKAPHIADSFENGGLQAQQRSSSVSAVSGEGSASASSQLTSSKRSVSTSISNFFKRISPHLGRKKRDRSNSNSRAGSSQSLPATSGVTMAAEASSSSTQHSTGSTAYSSAGSGHFSRSKIRNSFLKLMGGTRKDSKSKVTAAISSGSSPLSGDLNSSAGSDVSSNKNASTCDKTSPKGSMPESTQRMLKSMEKDSFGKKDVYREFKEKRSPYTVTSSNAAGENIEERYLAIKAQYKDRPSPGDDDFSFDAYDGAGASTLYAQPAVHPKSRTLPGREEAQKLKTVKAKVTEGGDVGRSGKAEPPSSLDVVSSRTIRLLQASTVSTISGDESIGECSLDCNLTASQPSLLSGTSQSAGSNLSKKAVFNQSLISSLEGQLLDPSRGQPASLHPPKDSLALGEELTSTSTQSAVCDKENTLALSPLSPSVGDPSHKPSYLKLSCAVSGYGKYSRYSSYKNIPTRSQFSSTSSLPSDLSSPDPAMPSLQSPDSGRIEGAVRSAGCSPTGAAIMARALSGGQSHHLAPPTFNGHIVQAPGMYPTGDPLKDGEYFLGIMASEEERLNQQAKRAEGLMRSQDLPEEVNGRIRAAIGKSNLLISQKFQQFKELCSQHMHPDPEDRIPLYEDLQGFWDMIKIQVDNVDDNFAEIDHMSQNGWKEIPRLVPSRRSSASSSPKSGSLSQASTPSATPGHTPGSRRRGLKGNNKDTPDSSPEHSQKIKSAAKARDEARKRMLAEKRAAMKQQQQQQEEAAAAPDIEIFLPEPNKK